MSLKKNDFPIRIMVIDDEKSVRDSLTRWFREFDYSVDSAQDATETLKKIKPGKYDVVFLDIKLPGMDGVELQRKIKEIDPEIYTIMITAYASVDTAVNTLKNGAYDYVTKPIDPDYLVHIISNIEKQKKLHRENVMLKERIQEIYEYNQIVGESPALLRVLEMIKAVAPTDTTVMIRGESGTGKELIARSIHALSPRRYFPIITINCGGLTEGLVESELFGHEKGAFTGAVYRRKGKLEMANLGTVFLDEIGSIDRKTQTDLLRAIETKQFTRVGGNDIVKVDFRVICATNQNLELAVERGEFREDLYYRLNVFSISIAPLRERRSDIPLLANHFLKKLTANMKKNIERFSSEALEVLSTYDWPGNIRELHNCIERAVVVTNGPTIQVESLPISKAGETAMDNNRLDAMEKRHIQNILDKMNSNITRSAEVLGIDRATLYNKIEKYGLRR